MLDINFIRENRDKVVEGMRKKGESDLTLADQVLEVDQQWRSLVTELDQLRATSNEQARRIGRLMSEGKKGEADRIIEETSKQKARIKKLEEELRIREEEREHLLLQIPNIPHHSVPTGETEKDNQEVDRWGNLLDQEWRKPHWELAEENGWIDFERGVKVTGSGFPFYVGAMARLQRALINFFIDQAVEAGYMEIEPPFFVNEDSARGTGQIPDKEDMMYVMSRDGFMAIPTAEVPVTNYLRNEILNESDLPVLYVAYTPCWRREAGSYGKEVRGLNRLHQFNKVELVKVVHPSASYDELESLKNYAGGLLQKLGLSYRTLLMCTGDMGFTQSMKYDLEVWSPGQERWLEVSSCSNFADFQARRLQLRYRDRKGKIEILHTLNGSGLALPRVVAALLETLQMEDGRVKVPEVLRPYMGQEFL